VWFLTKFEEQFEILNVNVEPDERGDRGETRPPEIPCQDPVNPANDPDRQLICRSNETTMNSLAKWNPLNELSDVHNRLSSFFGRPTLRNDGEGVLAFADWAPLVDVTEDEKQFLIKAELPEVKKEDVKVLIENGILRISGERHMEKEEKGKKYHRIERAYGTFERSFNLPENSRPEAMTAEYKDGMLTLSVPKTKESNPKPIEVKIA
jgi:HSP20 family protein